MTDSVKEPAACVLLSGGIDSTACVAFYLQQGFQVRGLFVDYGQAANAHEASAVDAVAHHYAIPLIQLVWSGRFKSDGGAIVPVEPFQIAASQSDAASPC